MNVFYEEDGGFKAGHVLSDQGTSMQVESSTGKRSKVKLAHVLFDFRDPDAATLMRDAHALGESIDLGFLWECAPQAEFSFKDLAVDYFGRVPTAVESAALVTRLHAAPMYFYRKGRGQYRSAPAEALNAALAGIERKRREAELQREYVDALVAGRLPDALRAHVRELLYKPDKNRVEWKALNEAAGARKTTPERLLLDVGGVPSTYDLHRGRFLVEQFPRGTDFPAVELPVLQPLPVADVEAFSIDDSMTTEIDDALSVRPLHRPDLAPGETAWRIGIHIAAPALVIARGDAIDTIARERYSTVYSPGEKITMLPDEVVSAFTLAAGTTCPTVSLSVDAIEAGDGTWRIDATASALESIRIVDNLRHDRLDDVVTEANLQSPDATFPHASELRVLWRFAKALHAKRQEARVASGLRPENHQRPDYTFRVDDDIVSITERRRGAPLDLVVAELMILANSTWGGLLAQAKVPGIYRAQAAAFGPAGRVRMVTHPAPHAGLGVAQYTWSTSPLRRYVDLVNQWQLVACIDPARGPAPFAANDADLFAIVSGFDGAYAAYADYQGRMERYWCLRWLEQRGLGIVEARATGRDDGALLVDIPLLVRVPGLSALDAEGKPLVTRGQRVEIDILAIDLVDLVAQCRLDAIIEEVDELDDEDVDASGPVEVVPVAEVVRLDPDHGDAVARAA